MRYIMTLPKTNVSQNLPTMNNPSPEPLGNTPSRRFRYGAEEK